MCQKQPEKKLYQGKKKRKRRASRKKHHVSVVAVGPRVIREGGKLYVALAAEVLVHNLERAWPSLPVVVIQEGPKKFFIFLWRCSTFRSYFWQADVRRGVIHRKCRKKPIELRSCSVRGARVWAQCAKRRYTQSCLEGRGRGVEFPLPPSTQTSSEVINLNPLTRHQNRRQWS